MVSVCAIEEDALSAVHGVCCCCLVLWTGPVSKSSGQPLQSGLLKVAASHVELGHISEAKLQPPVQTGGSVASDQLFKLAQIFTVLVKCFSSAPTNDAMLCAGGSAGRNQAWHRTLLSEVSASIYASEMHSWRDRWVVAQW